MSLDRNIISVGPTIWWSRKRISMLAYDPPNVVFNAILEGDGSFDNGIHQARVQAAILVGLKGQSLFAFGVNPDLLGRLKDPVAI